MQLYASIWIVRRPITFQLLHHRVEVFKNLVEACRDNFGTIIILDRQRLSIGTPK
jgi:hypothetical protein